MSTYLQLCQKTARDSGTVTGTNPASVASQTGWLLQIVNAVNDAWQRIQNAEATWRWLDTGFEGDTIVNTTAYTSTSWSLTRFSEWITEKGSVTIYKDSLGVSDEGELEFIDWLKYRQLYDRGTQTANRPIHWSISPANEFCLGPKPDAVYTVRGRYRKGNQTLSANADTPEMPDRFHELIVQEALEILAGQDEAPNAIIVAKGAKASYWSALRRDQLPQITIGGEPIA